MNKNKHTPEEFLYSIEYFLEHYKHLEHCDPKYKLPSQWLGKLHKVACEEVIKIKEKEPSAGNDNRFTELLNHTKGIRETILENRNFKDSEFLVTSPVYFDNYFEYFSHFEKLVKKYDYGLSN